MAWEASPEREGEREQRFRRRAGATQKGQKRPPQRKNWKARDPHTWRKGDKAGDCEGRGGGAQRAGLLLAEPPPPPPGLTIIKGQSRQQLWWGAAARRPAAEP